MDISVRDLHNDMIKTSENARLESVVDSVTQKILISDITLRSVILPQFRKMTLKLRQICGYDLCIIPKHIHIEFIIFRTILVTYLQHSHLGRHTHNSLFITTNY